METVTGIGAGAIESLIHSWMEQGLYPGAGLMLAREGMVIHEQYFGEWRAATLCNIGAAGAWLCSAAIASMVAERRICWDDRVVKWLPAWRDLKGDATLRQLLSHTAGYPVRLATGAKGGKTVGELVELIQSEAPRSRPGARFEYGELALPVAVRMAELAAGKEWRAAFCERIGTPLGMLDTQFAMAPPVRQRDSPSMPSATSSLRDYMRFLQMLRAEGEVRGRVVLPVSVVRQMQIDHAGRAMLPRDEFVERVRGNYHRSVYGLGMYREELDWRGNATLLSCPAASGAYPWIDLVAGIEGCFIGHVDTARAAELRFDAQSASARLPMLARAAWPF